MKMTTDIGKDGKAMGRLWGSPNGNYAMDGKPISSAAAFSMSHGSHMVSPFADDPTFLPWVPPGFKPLRESVLAFAWKAFRNPQKQVWLYEDRSGGVVLALGDYGNLTDKVYLGAIKGTPFGKRADQ